MTAAAEPARGRLSGRTALITGASRGIGRAVAVRYAQEGADLALVARSGAALDAVAREIHTLGRSARIFEADLANAGAAAQIAEAVVAPWGRLDILVGNAALLGEIRPLVEIGDQEWTHLVEVNLTANWRLLKALDPWLRRARAARAIFVTSTAAAGKARHGAYAVSKAGLECLVRVYAAEAAGTNVRANLINPGPARTQMRAKALPGEDPATVQRPEEKTEAFVALAEECWQRSGEIVMG
jgi:NAD(P)-dependent dehydrogenase (short-subunit alcohol dehydrogenase family)